MGWVSEMKRYMSQYVPALFYADDGMLMAPSVGEIERMIEASLEIVFQEQSYSSLLSGWSLAWDHFRVDIDDPCSIIADLCGVIADQFGVVAIPVANGGCAVGDADRCVTH